MRREVIIKTIAYLMLFFTLTTGISAQEKDTTKTLFDGDTKLSFVWGGEVKFNSIQDEIGSLIAFYGGALVNRSILLGLELGANAGHPTVNYSYLGLKSQYTFKPGEVLHPSVQLILAAASTKDYERSKSSTMDNFMNTSGTSFYFVEPGVNGEVNLSLKVRFLIGMSYRIAFGLDENSEHVAITKVTSQDMSGINFLIGVKIGEY